MLKYSVESIKSKIEGVARKHKLILVILFGSSAKGKEKDISDVDIAVLGEKTISFEEIIILNNEFADILEVSEVDMKSLHNTNPLFRYYVMRDGILLYGKSYTYYSFKAFAFRDYFDSYDLFELKERLIKKRLYSQGT